MNCPKRSETRLHALISKAFPTLLASDKEELDIDDYGDEDRSLIEPPLDFDPHAQADIVIKNARLGTDKHSDPCNIAISHNIITIVGDTAAIEAVMGSTTEILDAKGNSVLPGFTDSHLHLSVAMQRMGACDVEDATNLDQFTKKVAAFAKRNVDKPVLYVFGLHYFDDPILPADTCRHILDDIVGTKPMIVYAHDLHTAWGNTAAIETAGLLHKMPPYPDLIEELQLQDKIVLDAEMMPTGEFHEPEVYYFLVGPVEARFAHSVEEQLDSLKAVCEQLAGLGITGVHRMSLAQPAEDIALLLLMLELEQRGHLPIRINTSFSSVADSNMLRDVLRGYKARNALIKARNKEITAAELHDLLLELLKEAGGKRHDDIHRMSHKGGRGERHPHIKNIVSASEHVRTTTHKKHVEPHVSRDNPHREQPMPKHIGYHAKVRCDTIKIFMDGVIEKDTAFRCDKSPAHGIPEFHQDELNRLLEFADRLGMQVAAHSIGDGSVKSMLDAIAKARIKHAGLDARRGHVIPHRVEHIELCHEEDLHRFGKEHTVTSMQPLHERPPVTLWHELVPKEQWNTAFAWKEALDYGAVLVFGSDWPIVSCDVRLGINHAVTREPWYADARRQGVSLEKALDAYTTGAAHTEYSGNIKGQIKPGMLADIVIVSNHISELEHDKPQLEIETTICDGHIVYQSEPTPTSR